MEEIIPKKSGLLRTTSASFLKPKSSSINTEFLSTDTSSPTSKGHSKSASFSESMGPVSPGGSTLDLNDAGPNPKVALNIFKDRASRSASSLPEGSAVAGGSGGSGAVGGGGSGGDRSVMKKKIPKFLRRVTFSPAIMVLELCQYGDPVKNVSTLKQMLGIIPPRPPSPSPSPSVPVPESVAGSGSGPNPIPSSTSSEPIKLGNNETESNSTSSCNIPYEIDKDSTPRPSMSVTRKEDFFVSPTSSSLASSSPSKIEAIPSLKQPQTQQQQQQQQDLLSSSLKVPATVTTPIDVNTLCTPYNNLTPLHLACTHGHTLIVETLILEGGAHVNIRDREGWTPLHCAVAEGHVEVVKVLIR